YFASGNLVGNCVGENTDAAHVEVFQPSAGVKIASTGRRPPKNRGISCPRLYVMVWPSGVDTSTWQWSTSTTQNSRDPFSRHRFRLSSISAAVFDGDKTSITRSGAPIRYRSTESQRRATLYTMSVAQLSCLAQ